MCSDLNCGPKILIADASKSNRAALADILGEKCEITEAENGEQVMESLCRTCEKFELLLLNARLPEADGFAVLTRMEREGLLARVPVIMIVSDGSSDEIERACRLGVSEFISAPFRAAVVQKRVINTILLCTKKQELLTLAAGQKRFSGWLRDEFSKGFASEEKTDSDTAAQLLEQERSKRRFLAALTQEIQFEYKNDPAVLTLSSAGAERLQLDENIADPLQNEKLHGVISSSDLTALSEEVRSTSALQPVITHDCKINCGGEQRWFRILAMALWSEDKPSRFTGFIGKAIDIHESRLKISALEQLASHDALTGLYNHSYAQNKIEERMSTYPDAQFALAIIDLDYFKEANDKYGHIFGDRVLKHMADKLRQSIRGSDIAVRVGGDEFLIFLEYKMDLAPIIERIFASLEGKYEEFFISVSMGVSKAEGNTEYEDLFHRADQALYTAKQAGRGQYRFYDESMRKMLSAITPIESE